MASTNLELQSNYLAGYLKMLDMVKYAKRDASRETAETLTQLAEEYREWVRRLAQLDDLPPVPKE